jgi:RimJ/RimL family protein N-acetyltransferase
MTPTLIALSRFEPGDIPELLEWIPDAVALARWSGPSYHISSLQEDLLSDYELTNNDPPSLLMFKIIDHPTSTAIGHVQVFVDRTNNLALMGRLLIGPTKLRNRGVGGNAIQRVLQYCFQTLGLHRVSLNVYENNPAAIRCYERTGFKKEGILREATKIGEEYWTSIVMGMLAAEFRTTSPNM